MVMEFVGKLMKITDLYEENRFLTDKDEILIWMRESFQDFDPNLLEIESDGLVYDGNLILMNNVDKLKVQFKEVTFNFSCVNSKISNLEGCPGIVGDYFSCSSTNITSLKFFPRLIGADFYCINVKIIDPKEYRYALYSEIGGKFMSINDKIDEIVNTYSGSANRKYWPQAINLLSKVKL